ncbi:MAG TPA: GDSL-type esterase/lipase family protein [Vicinamibacterales bacterium]|nr:GDSL-type esterase/lipase family protein [Vicinamibacterales bacterium]
MHRALLLIGLASALTGTACNKGGTPTSPTPTSQVLYGVVGASDAVGFGSSAPCLPWEDCPGNGYAPIVKRRFQADGATVQLANRGIPGAVLSPALLTLAQETGRTDIRGTLIEQAAPFIPSNSTHVSIFAGGNDANVIGQAVRAGRAGGNVAGFVDQHVNQFGVDLVDLVARVRLRSPTARIVAFNLPNLAVAPYVSSATVIEKSILQRIAVGLTDRINALSAQGVIVVDLMCEPRSYNPANISSDGFHPSDAGYELMADLLYPALRNGTAPAPSGSCPQRAIVPVF